MCLLILSCIHSFSMEIRLVLTNVLINNLYFFTPVTLFHLTPPTETCSRKIVPSKSFDLLIFISDKGQRMTMKKPQRLLLVTWMLWWPTFSSSAHRWGPPVLYPCDSRDLGDLHSTTTYWTCCWRHVTSRSYTPVQSRAGCSSSWNTENKIRVEF